MKAAVLLCLWAFWVQVGHSSVGDYVVALTDKNFDDKVANTEQVWIVEFYAPWCAHCQRLLPIIEEASRALKGSLRFGKVNCDEETGLRSRFGIESYPHLYFFVAGTASPVSKDVARKYVGPRTLEGFTAFAQRMNRPALLDIPPATDLQEFARDTGVGNVLFVICDPGRGSSTGGARAAFSKAYGTVAARLQDQLAFAKVRADDLSREGFAGVRKYIDPDSLGVPKGHIFVARVESGEAHIEVAAATSNIPDAARSTKIASITTLDQSDPVTALENWVEGHRFPTFAALGPDNFHLLANNQAGAHLVIAVIHEAELVDYEARRNHSARPLVPPASAAFHDAVHRLASRGATTLFPTIRDKFLFGWLDATKFEGFIRQFNLSPADAPQLVVVDPPSKRFWHDWTVHEYDEMESYLYDVAGGRAPVQRQGFLSVPQKMYNALGWFAIPIIVIAVLLVLWAVYKLVLIDLLWGRQSSPPPVSKLSQAEQESKEHNADENSSPSAIPLSIGSRKSGMSPRAVTPDGHTASPGSPTATPTSSPRGSVSSGGIRQRKHSISK